MGSLNGRDCTLGQQKKVIGSGIRSPEGERWLSPHSYVDADHARDEATTRRSVMGVLIFWNCTPICWYSSKRQATVESSTHSSELVAARIATEMVLEMRIMLRALGIPVNGLSYLFGDDLSVVTNTTIPSSMLKKKHNAISYHRVREAVAETCTQDVPTVNSNPMATEDRDGLEWIFQWEWMSCTRLTIVYSL